MKFGFDWPSSFEEDVRTLWMDGWTPDGHLSVGILLIHLASPRLR